jgi:hypothetical protein
MKTNSNKTQKNPNQKTKAFKLSLLAGALIVFNSALLGVVAAWFPQIMPTLPGSSGNDPALLFSLSAIGLTLGVLLLINSALLHYRPANPKTCGIIVAVFSLLSIISGGGFIVGCILGILGAKTAITHNNSS